VQQRTVVLTVSQADEAAIAYHKLFISHRTDDSLLGAAEMTGALYVHS
jgi:hypothetical protein